MEKIYKFLLNRKPSQLEIKQNRNKPLNLINKEIVNSEEYTQYTNHIKDLIINNYATVFRLNKNNIKMSSIDLFNKMKFLRNNQYNLAKLNKIITISFNNSNIYINNFLGKFPKNNLINNKDFIQKNYLDLIANNFNYLEMEYNIINSKIFNKYFI